MKLSREKFEEWRSMLEKQEGRHITVNEFAEIIGIHDRALDHILAGRRGVGREVAQKLLALRQRGVMVHLSDLEYHGEVKRPKKPSSKPPPWLRR